MASHPEGQFFNDFRWLHLQTLVKEPSCFNGLGANLQTRLCSVPGSEDDSRTQSGRSGRAMASGPIGPHTCRSRSRPGSAQLGRVQTLRAILTKPSPEPPRAGAPQAERQAGHASAGLGRNRLQLRFGAELYAAAQRSDGQIVEVGPYLFSKPGTTAPAVPNLSFVARVGELGCGVGYYKQGWVERRALRVVR